MRRDERMQEDFLGSFPEVYREQGGFFARYLKVLSSVYDEVQEAVEKRAEILDIEKADRERLIQYAAWFGFDCGGSVFDDDELRRIVGSLSGWNRKKGTKTVVQEILKDFYKEEAFLCEKEDGEVAIVMEGRKGRKEKEKILFLLEQFIPAGVRLLILDGADGGGMGGIVFTEVNSILVTPDERRLDIQAALE